MDREAIARQARRQQVADALEFERDREKAIQDQIAIAIAEVDGPRIDTDVFARMSPDDVELVRAELNPLPYAAEDGPEFERDAFVDFDDVEQGDDPHAEELARLNEELALSRRRKQAFEAYLAALDGPGADELSI
ncbi:MAG TPA: hypothetical protein VHS03_06715 [Gaiellaceae bacterium]|nr:hypothetical protein [Gaiellaceae bacterium]